MFYVIQLDVGLHFLAPPFYSEVASLFNVPSNQLVPKSLSLVDGEEPSVEQLQSFFHLK